MLIIPGKVDGRSCLPYNYNVRINMRKLGVEVLARQLET